MATPGAAYIVKQPRDHDIPNSFGLMGNEHFIRSWALKEERCECSGSYYTALTDTRLLMRYSETSCCSSCCEPGHRDVSIFLRDIAEVREATETQDCCSRCFLKFCACFVCCACCENCCSAQKFIEIRGSFGSEMLHVPKADTAKLQIEIPAAIGNHKLVSQY